LNPVAQAVLFAFALAGYGQQARRLVQDQQMRIDVNRFKA
jgi:hypothetical protein